MDILKRFYFNSITSCIRGASKVISKVRSPNSVKETFYSDVERVSAELLPGDIILTRTEGELSTGLIPGYWKHCAMAINDKEVIEASTHGVRINHLANLIMKTDNYAVLRINFEYLKAKGYDCSGAEKKADIINMINFLIDKMGLPYNYSMDISSNDKEFCSGLLFKAISSVWPCNYLELRYRLGFPTFTPNDFYEAKNKFDLILEKRD